MKPEDWSNFTFEVPKTNGFLTLPDCIKEHICRFLIKRADQLEACLIHREWTTSAQAVLWERPRFARPENFGLFMATIQNNKKCALLVHDLQLVILDKHPTCFTPIVKSTLERHHSPNVLQDPNTMLTVAVHCQRITTLEIYGWRLKAKQIEMLSTYAKNLTSLHIVGADPGIATPLSLNSLLPRLTTLRLDGQFNLNSTWASALVKRANCLNRLQLSLRGMESQTMSAICSPSLAGLTELTLTDASSLTDVFVERMLTVFSKLTRLCIEGCANITSLSIAYAVRLCLNLKDLEIRGIKNNVDIEDDVDTQLENYLDQYHETARPIRFLLEHSNITDHQMELLGPSLVHIQTLGLKGCSNVTNQCLEKTIIYHEVKHLRTIQILSCPRIDSGFLSLLADSYTIPLSIMQLYIADSGDMCPKDIYSLCCSSVDHNLREIRLVGYPNLLQSVIGTFNEDHGKTSLLLNRRSLDALSHSTDPELHNPPTERFLTSRQIILLAKKLSMSLEVLEALFDQVVKEEEAEEATRLHKEQLPYNPSPLDYSSKKSVSRLDALKITPTEQRPTTPAIWSDDYKLNNAVVTNPKLPDYPPFTKENSASSSNIATSGESGSDDTYERDNTSDDKTIADYEEEEEEMEDDFDYVINDKEEEEYIKTSSTTAWSNTLSESGQHEMKLGGWEAATNNHWNTTSTPTLPFKSNNATPKPFSFTAAQQQQQQTSGAWSNYSEETYSDRWNQKDLEKPYAVKSKKNMKLAYNGNSPAVTESEGWGDCNNIIPWEDAEKQGFVKEVLEEQKSTTYWKQEDNGWIPLSGENTDVPMQDQVNHSRPTRRDRESRAISVTSSDEEYPAFIDGTNTSNLIQSSPPLMSFSALKEDVQGTSRSNRTSGYRHIVPSTKNTRISRPRSDSVVSSDASVTWNEKESVTIKVHDDQEKPSMRNVQPAPRDQSKWVNAKDWENRKDVSTTTIVTTKSSWQNEFDTEATKSKAAKKEWSSLTSSNQRTFSRQQRTTVGSRTSTPQRTSTTPSPPPSAQQVAAPAASSILLIDTKDSSNTHTKHTRKGDDVWESMNDLNINSNPSTGHVRVPSETNPIKSPSFEVLDWPLNQEIANDTTNDNNIPKPVRFVETISGTVTDAEQKQAQKIQDNDILISVDDTTNDLLPFSSSTHAATTATNSISPAAFAAFDGPAITTTTANIATPVIGNPTTIEAPAASETPTVIVEHDHISDLISDPLQLQPLQQQLQQPQSQPQSQPQQLPESPSISPMAKPIKKSKRPLLIRISFESGPQILTVPTEEQSLEAIMDFCKEHDCMNYIDTITDKVKQRWTARNTKSILSRGSRKPKKSSPDIQ